MLDNARRELRDGWRYERRPMLMLLGVLALSVVLLVAGVYGLYIGWTTPGDKTGIALVTGYVVGTLTTSRRK